MDTLTWWRKARLMSKPATNNQRTYLTKNDQFTRKLEMVVEALAREGPRKGVDVAEVMEVSK